MAVLAYQYVDVGAIGPLPKMYDPQAPLTAAVRMLRVHGPTPLETRPC
jgi:hypothetical protein